MYIHHLGTPSRDTPMEVHLAGIHPGRYTGGHMHPRRYTGGHIHPRRYTLWVLHTLRYTLWVMHTLRYTGGREATP